MKKFIILFIFLSSFIFAQEVIIIQDDYELIIPSDYYDLKNAYIIMANLHLESEDNLTDSVQNFKDLKVEYDNIKTLLKESEDDNKDLTDLIDDELNPNAEKLEDKIDTLTKELEKWIKPNLFQLYAGASFSNEIIPNIHVGPFINLVILEQFSIQVEYLLLDQYSVSIGYKLF